MKMLHDLFLSTAYTCPPDRQVTVAQGLAFISQLAPSNPETHSQEYLLSPSTHLAAFTHGLDSHSFTLTSQFIPFCMKEKT